VKNFKEMDMNYHITQVYGRNTQPGMNITIERSGEMRRKQAPKELSPSSKKYVNTRIYDQTEARGKIEP